MACNSDIPYWTQQSQLLHFPSYLPSNIPGEAMKDALGAWTPATQVQDPERAGSWLWPRLAPTVEAIWEMNHKIEKKNLLFSFQIYCFKKCTWFSCNKAIYFFSKVQKCLLQVLSFFLPTLLLRGLPGSTQSRVLRQHSAKEKGADRTGCTTDRLQQTHKPQKLGSSAGEVNLPPFPKHT